MKKSFFLISTVSILFLFACKKDGVHPQIDCTGNCIFALTNAKGTIVKMACFDRFAIKTNMSGEDGETFIFGIPDVLGENFQEEGKAVRFSGEFRDNELTPTFPDPSIDVNTLYQIKLLDIKDL